MRTAVHFPAAFSDFEALRVWLFVVFLCDFERGFLTLSMVGCLSNVDISASFFYYWEMVSIILDGVVKVDVVV